MAQPAIRGARRAALISALAPVAALLRRSRRTAPRTKPASVMVVEFGNIGDFVLLMPFLAELRATFPGARIALVAKPPARDVLDGSGLVDEIVAVEFDWWRSNPIRYDWTALRRLLALVRGRSFDIAFGCRINVREHVFLASSGARRTVAFALGSPASEIVTDPVPVGEPDRHKADDWLRLLEPFGGPRGVEAPAIRVRPEEVRAAREFLARAGVATGGVVVGVHPGASFAEKRWSLDRFVEVAVRLARADRTWVLWFVDPSGYGAAAAPAGRVIECRFDLRALIGAIGECDALVCNDSGPMHLAAASGVPTVAVFTIGKPGWFGPRGPGHVVYTGDATVEGVLSGVFSVLGRRGAARR